MHAEHINRAELPDASKRSKRGATALSVAVAALAVLTSARADAFCRTTTVPPAPDHGSVDGTFEGMDPCWTQGKPLYHGTYCLPYRLLANDAPAVPLAALSVLLSDSFTAWTAPSSLCTPGITPLELAPVTNEPIVNYRTGERGRNIVGVPPTWTHVGSNDTLSLATLTFNADTGEIYDVDLEINGGIPWALNNPVPADGFDLQSALTHEVGHMLGLAHSPVVEATMFAAYVPGSIGQRTLDKDDQNAVCTVYPNRAQRLAAGGLIPSTGCNLAPDNGTGGCGEPEIRNGCAMGRGIRESGGVLGLVAAIGGVIALRRRRART
jgi:hypothetical protein